jgi:hypothetical protein
MPGVCLLAPPAKGRRNGGIQERRSSAAPFTFDAAAMKTEELHVIAIKAWLLNPYQRQVFG